MDVNVPLGMRETGKSLKGAHEIPPGVKDSFNCGVGPQRSR